MAPGPARLRLIALVAAFVVAACGGAASPSPGVGPTPPPTSVQGTPVLSPSSTPNPTGGPLGFDLSDYPVIAGSRPHDVAPAADGGVWYTGQGNGTLGHLDPMTGNVREIDLGDGSSPHGVITGPDGAAWITDSGLNAIVRVDPATNEVRAFTLPDDRPRANLNTAVFAPDGRLWFTGQNGIYGSLDPASGELYAYAAPRGRGPYGITVTSDGVIWYASLAGSYLGRVDPVTGEATVIEPPTAGQGARRVWADSRDRIWVSEWNAGQVAVYDPADGSWREWRLPGSNPQAYSVYVDDRDLVWLTDFGANAIVVFDPASESFTVLELDAPGAAIRQMLSRPGEAWGAASSADKLYVVRLVYS